MSDEVLCVPDQIYPDPDNDNQCSCSKVWALSAEIDRLRPAAESWESYVAAQERKGQPIETSDARDAARYRFLRQPGNAIVYAKDRNAWGKSASGHVAYDTAEQLDAAVDAARGAVVPTPPHPEDGPYSRLTDAELLRKITASAVLRRYEGLNDRILELIRRFDHLFGSWAALSQDDGKKDSEIDRLNAELEDKKKEVRFYGGHLPSCDGRPCECGFLYAYDSSSQPRGVAK